MGLGDRHVTFVLRQQPLQRPPRVAIAATRHRAKARASSLGISAILAADGGFINGFTHVGHECVVANAMSANGFPLSYVRRVDIDVDANGF